MAKVIVDQTMHDLGRIAIAALLANLLFLMLFLRALVAPIGLLACSVLAIGATLGPDHLAVPGRPRRRRADLLRAVRRRRAAGRARLGLQHLRHRPGLEGGPGTPAARGAGASRCRSRPAPSAPPRSPSRSASACWRWCRCGRSGSSPSRCPSASSSTRSSSAPCSRRRCSPSSGRRASGRDANSSAGGGVPASSSSNPAEPARRAVLPEALVPPAGPIGYTRNDPDLCRGFRGVSALKFRGGWGGAAR